jgi:DNA-binding MarR family transcriptional regulator
LVAFTIEVDNEAEHRMPHRTSADRGKGGSGPWLTSLAMVSNCLEHLSEEWMTVAELTQRARTHTNLPGMTRWGYIKTDLAVQPKTSNLFKPTTLIRLTRAGLAAQKVWAPLGGEIEQRWRERFGQELGGDLRTALVAIVSRLSPTLPDCMPILGYGLRNEGPASWMEMNSGQEASGLGLVALLSKALLSFALAYEHHSQVSLAIGANVLRVIDQKGTRVRDLPVLSGVSKESIAMALGFLESQGYAEQEPLAPPERGRQVVLTAKGAEEKEAYFDRLGRVEARWKEHFGETTIENLRKILSGLNLFEGLKPHPGNWRSTLPTPKILPHFPMVLHRGGYPDGS